MERDWIVLDDTLKNTETDSFQAVCYNILCDKYATPSQYGYAASWTLEWSYRRERILSQLLDSKAEIFCLQEVDADTFDDFAQQLAEGDYRGIHQPKSRAKTMSEGERKKVDGCATFYKTTK